MFCFFCFASLVYGTMCVHMNRTAHNYFHASNYKLILLTGTMWAEFNTGERKKQQQMKMTNTTENPFNVLRSIYNAHAPQCSPRSHIHTQLLTQSLKSTIITCYALSPVLIIETIRTIKLKQKRQCTQREDDVHISADTHTRCTRRANINAKWLVIFALLSRAFVLVRRCVYFFSFCCVIISSDSNHSYIMNRTFHMYTHLSIL